MQPHVSNPKCMVKMERRYCVLMGGSSRCWRQTAQSKSKKIIVLGNRIEFNKKKGLIGVICFHIYIEVDFSSVFFELPNNWLHCSNFIFAVTIKNLIRSLF